jgi:hypothetical protein
MTSPNTTIPMETAMSQVRQKREGRMVSSRLRYRTLRLKPPPNGLEMSRPASQG